MNPELGPWEPLPLDDAVALFSPASFRWWVTGGHALELHFGRSWRDHEDTDMSFCRSDAALVRELLSGWDIHVAADGVLTPWMGAPLSTDLNHNNLWCKRTVEGPWRLDLTVSDGDEHAWIFRRDPTLRVPWEQAVLTSADGVPYLAPELQLLFKSKDRRPKDDVDAAEVLPLLDPARRAFLESWLPAGHPWLGEGRV